MNTLANKRKGFSTKILASLFRCVAWFVIKIFFRNKKQRIWMIGCGGERWGDNADAFWGYLNEEHSNLNAIAVVRKKAGAIDKSGNWIFKRTIQNYLYVFASEALITTHSLYDLGPSILVDHSNATKVWLQHGVTGLGKWPPYDQKLMKFDLICASSVREKQIMVEEMKLEAEKVAITGLARHDRLRLKMAEGKREDILYMPTFRDWVTGEDKKMYQELLFSWVERYLADNHLLKLKIWLHPNWQKKGFEINKSLKAHAIDPKTDLQDILLQSELLVTDYSSVAFDAALAGIPVVFFQPDRKIYAERKGLFSDFVKQKDLLITEDAGNLVEIIEKILSDKEYREYRLAKDRQWANQYVETFDGKCCERIFNEINVLVNDL